MSVNETQVSAVEAVLCRSIRVDVLAALNNAIGSKPPEAADPKEFAVAWDSNVFLKLAKESAYEDVVDYFSTKHQGPFILPGQVVQEFWNNQFNAMQSVSASLAKNLDAVEADVSKIDDALLMPKEKSELLASLKQDYAFLRDKNTTSKLQTICNMLNNRARSEFVPRIRFTPIAGYRKQTKTPPGFKDELLGDFFVWADFLVSLVAEIDHRGGVKPARVVLVTDDKKVDWCTGGVAHPVLVAEVQALVEVPFEIWSLGTLMKAVRLED